MLEAIDRVAEFPGTGRMVPEINDPAIWETLVYSYRVLYRVTSEAIHVAAMVHGARDLMGAISRRTI